MRLRELELKDVQGMLEWMHDPKVNIYFRFSPENRTQDMVEQFITQAKQDMKQKKNYHFAIVTDDDEYMGTISLKNVDWQAGVTEYAICLRSKAQGKGIGTWATNTLLQYAFEELKLNRVFLNVLSDNDTAIRLYEKCGFRYEGIFKNHICVRNVVKSLKWYAILKEEWMEYAYRKAPDKNIIDRKNE